jgi:cell division septation protein DedD
MKRVTLALLLVIGSVAIAAVATAATSPDIRALQDKAQAGDADAEFELGEAYRAGRGVNADPESAIMWYRRATALGHVRASEELGFALFAHGDRREAMPYIERAAARGEARAFYLLGTAHFNGDYATRDWPLAYAQTMRAAAAGLPAAQKNLELMGHYLLPADKAKADQILATLPSLRGAAQQDAASAAKPAPVQTADASPPPKPAKPGKSPKPVKAVAATPAADATPQVAPAKSATADAADGAWKVQLGAFGSADRARDRWKSLAAGVSRLDRYDQRIVAAGSVQRLQAAGIAGRADANALCKDVRAAGGDCLVIAP